MEDLIKRIAEVLQAAGWQVVLSADTLVATREDILSKWLLGSRRVTSRINCRLDASAKTLFYRETAKQLAIGIPPPSFSVSTYTQHGLEFDETRQDTSLACGGGRMDYGKARRLLQDLCAENGWSFNLQLITTG